MPFVRGLLDLAARQICSLSNEGSFDAVFWLRALHSFVNGPLRWLVEESSWQRELILLCWHIPRVIVEFERLEKSLL